MKNNLIMIIRITICWPVRDARMVQTPGGDGTTLLVQCRIDGEGEFSVAFRRDNYRGCGWH